MHVTATILQSMETIFGIGKLVQVSRFSALWRSEGSCFCVSLTLHVSDKPALFCWFGSADGAWDGLAARLVRWRLRACAARMATEYYLLVVK